jgi:phosphate transport system substrate-binding protein
MKQVMRIATMLALIAIGSIPVFAAESGIIGAGATFPYPLYSKMFDAYNQEYGIKVNYQGIGSSGGIKELTNKTVDFAGTDAFMTDGEMKKASGAVVHVPTCIGSVVLTYNLKGVADLSLSQSVLADIFLGKITRWNDPKIVKLNSKAKLPDLPIAVIHRSDGSGTTSIFTDFLAIVSPAWKSKVGAGKTVNWPAGLGAAKNSGVAGMVQKVPGSIGYVELAYAIENKMPVALIENKSGKFIKPTVESTSLAAKGEIPADTRVSLNNTSDPKGYPIAGFTWIVLYKEQNYNGRTLDQAKSVVALISWMTHEGQKFTSPLLYAPLPSEVVKKAEKLLKSVTYNGKPVSK